MKPLKWATALVLIAVVACVPALAGCGGDSGGTAEGEAVTLKVGVIPIADVAPLFVGMERGFFKEEKLTIKPQFAEGGAAIVTSTVAGDYQIGFSNTTSLIIAGSKKLPVKIISQGVLGAASPDKAWDAVLVKKGSDIRTPKDLEGKTVSVNTLQNVGPLTINTALKKAGADYTKVKYIEVPFPDANAALQAGRIDAAFVVEPFVTQGKGQGSTPLLHSFEETAPNLTIATYFSTDEYISKNGDVIDRFVRAMNKSLTYTQQHPEAVRKAVLDYTEIPPEAAQAMALPQWRADLNRPTIELTAKLAKDYGFIEEEPNLDDLIRQP
ncbi:MAG TPA: ABC transporter substrate-binding protein [Thermoleophilaceae bacterium]